VEEWTTEVDYILGEDLHNSFLKTSKKGASW